LVHDTPTPGRSERRRHGQPHQAALGDAPLGSLPQALGELLPQARDNDPTSHSTGPYDRGGGVWVGAGGRDRDERSRIADRLEAGADARPVARGVERCGETGRRGKGESGEGDCVLLAKWDASVGEAGVGEAELRRVLGAYGPVATVRAVKGQGLAFVKFSSQAAAEGLLSATQVVSVGGVRVVLCRRS
jgi:hypothetical protein